jgi:signal transduction histidine kinase
MDYLQKLIRQAKLDLFALILINNLALIGVWFACKQVFKLGAIEIVAILILVSLIEVSLISLTLPTYLMQPLVALWQAILHLSPNTAPSQAPQTQDLSFGKDLVGNLLSHIYQFIDVAEKVGTESSKKAKDLSNNFVAQNLPMPFFVLDNSETIKYANQAAAKYLGVIPGDLTGKSIYMALDMSFPSDDTFDAWLKNAKASSATASNAWERVKLDVRDSHPTYLFDLAAYYNRDNADHNETMLLLFDHTKSYSQDEQAISFVALGVHELRTPLTLLRGYIEVFEEELEGKLDPELQGFMEKMHAQVEQLMSFVNNILNVARIDDDQMELKLEETTWSEVLNPTIEALTIRAKVRGITMECNIAKDLPTVAVDRLSIQEVINNLVDNAIKYSSKSTVIKVDAHLTKDNLVETTIQDYGVGIDTALMPNLFTKFYRDHHNRSQIGGTGLGLYLSKSIVKANSGNLWVRSKQGEGSVFGFTLQPYSSLNIKSPKDRQELIKGAHGWIKNHSLYRQ